MSIVEEMMEEKLNFIRPIGCRLWRILAGMGRKGKDSTRHEKGMNNNRNNATIHSDCLIARVPCLWGVGLRWLLRGLLRVL